VFAGLGADDMDCFEEGSLMVVDQLGLVDLKRYPIHLPSSDE